MKGLMKASLRWFGHIERVERDRIAKRVYVGECAGSRSVGRPRKRWIDTVKECLKKRGLDIRQAKRRAGVCKGECLGRSPGDEPQTLARYHSCGLLQLCEAFVGWKSVLWPSLQLKGYKGEIFCFSSLS